MVVPLFDSVLGAIMGEFLKGLIKEAKQFRDFKPLSEDLATTLECFIPYTMDIEKKMKEVGVMDTRMENLWKIFQRAEEAIYEYPTVMYIRRSQFTRKIEKINNDLLKFCQMEMQFNQLNLMVSLQQLNVVKEKEKEKDDKKIEDNAEGVDVPSWVGDRLKELDSCIPYLSQVTELLQDIQCIDMKKVTHLRSTLLIRVKVFHRMVFDTKQALQNLRTSSMVSIIHALKMVETFNNSESEINSLLSDFEKELDVNMPSSTNKRLISAVTSVDCQIGKKSFWCKDIGVVPTEVVHKIQVTFANFRGYRGEVTSARKDTDSSRQLWYLMKADNEEAPAIAADDNEEADNEEEKAPAIAEPRFEIPELESFYFPLDDISELESFFFLLVDNSQSNTTSSNPKQVIRHHSAAGDFYKGSSSGSALEATRNKSF